MATLHPGQMLAGTSYQIIREIGAGGMGVVYEVEHVRLKKRYVTKVIHEQIQNEDGALKRMEREAQVLAAISHPNVVQVHDFGVADGVTYFVMDKLDGVDLRKLMKQRVTVPRLQSIGIIADVLEALDHVHRRGIVHRDIKPENIFLSEQVQGTVTKVLDFGIVSIVDGDGRLSQGRITKTGGFVGTLYYAAPEQMQGKPPGPPNDVYAAGLVLFELLTGKGPFDDDPGVGLSRCFKPAPRLIDVSKTPPALSDAVARALHTEPSARPTAGALAAELRAVAAALRATPGEEDVVRAEVDDLLAQFAPSGQTHGHAHAHQPAPVRPAAGRNVTPAPGFVDPNAVEGTAVPQTPLMPGAPGRVPAAAAGSFDATMMSPEEAPPAAARAPYLTPPGANIGASMGTGPNPYANPNASTNPNPSAGMMGTPAGSPGMPGSPGTHMGLAPAFVPSGAHAVSAPPPSPRFPPGASGGAGPNPMFGGGRPGSNPGMPPTFSSSPGVYATISEPGSATPQKSSGPWVAIAASAGALILIGILGAGAFVWREKSTTTAAATSPSASAIVAPTVPSSSTTTPDVPTVAAAASTAPTPAMTPTPSPTATATAVAIASASGSAPAVATKPNGVKPPVTTPTTATPVAPRPTNSAHNAEKDGYVKNL